MTPKSQADGVFTAGSQPFTTQDVALAFSLYLAGVPFQDPTQPCLNLYDAEILSKIGYRNWKLEDAARDALAKNKKGEVRYIFARTPELNDLLEAYKTQQIVIQKGEGTAVEHFAELIPDPELRLKVAEVVLKMRPEFVNLWKEQSPLIRVPNPGQSKTTDLGKDQKLVSSPGFRVISLNASPSTRKRLKL